MSTETEHKLQTRKCVGLAVTTYYAAINKPNLNKPLTS